MLQRLLIWFSVAFFFFALYVTAPTLAAYAHSLNFPSWLVGITVGAYGWAMVLCRLPVGRYTNRIGAKRVILLSLISILLGLCLPLISSFHAVLLPVSRFMIGAGASAFVVYSVLFSRHYSESDVAKATSIITLAYAFPQLFAAWVGGYFSQQFGWLGPFVLGIPAVLISIGLLFFISTPTITVTREYGSLEKILSKRLIVNSIFAMVGFLVSFATFYGFSQIYAIQLGGTKQDLGLILSAMVLPFMIFIFLASKIQAWIGAATTLVTGLLLLGISILVIPLSTTVWMLAIIQSFGGIGFGLVFPTSMAQALLGTAPENKYWVMGIYQTIYAFGFAIGPSIAGLIVHNLGLPYVFWSMGSLTILSIGLILLLIPKSKVSTRVVSSDQPASVSSN